MSWNSGEAHWPKKKRKQPVARKAIVQPSAPFVEVKSHTLRAQFELEIRGRRLHIPEGFDAQQLRSLLAILETA